MLGCCLCSGLHVLLIVSVYIAEIMTMVCQQQRRFGGDA